ncbi:uncharacterized protein LOC113361921 [Papaver somniferum]|uniref:uncharacterized protein LOC113361921 n=1 Tax=Papaver somniferum TaxID=3469 RepID=UPI000E6F9BB9|nr:uncharacterized protein LOC113361921 [Papaver somniferum]
MGRRRNSPVNELFGWIRKQSMKVKIFLGVVTAILSLVGLKYSVKDHNHFFVASEAVHAAGIFVLVYKLITKKTCSGLAKLDPRVEAERDICLLQSELGPESTPVPESVSRCIKF